jgi:hypothetical protein
VWPWMEEPSAAEFSGHNGQRSTHLNINNRDSGQQWSSSSHGIFYSSSPLSSPPPLSTSPQLAADKPFSLQNRRLRLRNSGFRGGRFPTQKVPDPLSTPASVSKSSPVGSEKENSRAWSPSGCELDAIGSVQSKANALQEIYDLSSHRPPSAFGSPVTTLPQDSLGERNEGPYLLPSPFENDLGTLNPSPPLNKSYEFHTEPMMQPGDLSGGPPSPFVRTAGKCSRDCGSRPASYETTRYIEHLEAQLAASQSQLNSVQALPSKPQVLKLKSLYAELRALKQELAEWESKFEARVRRELVAISEADAKSRVRIRVLESRVEADLRRIKELEHERDIQAQKLRDTETLKSANRCLERRVDVLTELLAQSPMRLRQQQRSLTHGHGALSPLRSHGPKLPRLKSVLASVATSPKGESLFQSPVVPESEITNDENQPPDQPIQSRIDSRVNQQLLLPNSPESSVASISALTDSVSQELAMSLTPMSKPQRCSIISPSWISPQRDLPSVTPPDAQEKTQNRHRRRFPSGRCTLKPLILPATTVTGSNHYSPASAHLNSSVVQPLHSSPDFTGAFLDIEDYGASPNSPSGRHPGSQRKTLDVIRGRSIYDETFAELISGHENEIQTSISSPDDSPFCNPGQGFAMDDHDYWPQDYPDARALALFQSAHGSKIDSQAENAIPGEPVGTVHSPGEYYRNEDQHYREREGIHLAKMESRSRTKSEVWAPKQVTRSGFRFLCSDRLRKLRVHIHALVRNVIANAWNSNLRSCSRLSWPMLGYLLGPQPMYTQNKCCPMTAPDGHCWNFPSGEARRFRSGCVLEKPPSSRVCRLELGTCPDSLDLRGASRIGSGWPDVFRIFSGKAFSSLCTSFGRSLYMWAKFSFALVFAIGLALKHGPGFLLEEVPPLRVPDTTPRQRCQNEVVLSGSDGNGPAAKDRRDSNFSGSTTVADDIPSATPTCSCAHRF